MFVDISPPVWEGRGSNSQTSTSLGADLELIKSSNKSLLSGFWLRWVQVFSNSEAQGKGLYLKRFLAWFILKSCYNSFLFSHHPIPVSGAVEQSWHFLSHFTHRRDTNPTKSLFEGLQNRSFGKTKIKLDDQYPLVNLHSWLEISLFLDVV